MTLLRPLVAALALVLAASPAAAQETLQFTNPGTVTWNGVYVGPYQAQILSDPTRPTIDIYCVDFAHAVTRNQVWTAHFTPLTHDLSDTRGGNAARELYKQAAWLTTQFNDNANRTKAIQSAIWNLFLGSAPDHANAGYWLAEAATNYTEHGDDYYSRFSVVTDVNMAERTSAQEFITSTVPEPSTYLMMASGLLALVGVARNRRRHTQG